MIVEMKKISLLVLSEEKRAALKQLRKLGLVHISEVQGSSEKLSELKGQVSRLQQSMSLVQEQHNKKDKVSQEEIDTKRALEITDQILTLTEEKKALAAAMNQNLSELDRVKAWGDFDPQDLAYLSEKGIVLTPYEMPVSAYEAIGDEIQTIMLGTEKKTVRILVCGEPENLPEGAKYFELPKKSQTQMRKENAAYEAQIQEKNEAIAKLYCYHDGMKLAIKRIEKDIEFENYDSGMGLEALSEDGKTNLKIAYLNGYIPTEDLPKLLEAAKANHWGVAAEDPTEEDNVPTKLQNNKLVSLIYPLTDFLGTVPGYFEYDISGWFLGFMLIFFGIIFGDGGYGLLITGVAAALVIKAKVGKEEVKPLYLLVGLFGIATMIWGTVTCTWFGIEAEKIPTWLQNLSIPVISNVYEDNIWYPFWTNGEAGLTTAQNLQIFCFILAVVQLSVAHIKAFIRHKKSLRQIGDLGSLLQLWGMFYVVLTMVVNSEVFGLSRVINGIPVGTVSIAFVAVGFVMSFIFGSYEGSVKDSILDSLKNIISILLGVVNVFSDIVSYIRLWAVGLAGAAISATVNEMAGPMLGHLAFIIVAIVLLVFGHGLNMILNTLSMIVHGVRLNTLEFSSHLDMSWSGHKYQPFEEEE